MKWLDSLGEAISGLFGLIDDMHTSEEEKMELKNKMFRMQIDMVNSALEYEKQVATMKAEVIKAEAQGGSWIQQNWRPITMLTFLVLVVCDSFGILAFRLADEAWTLLQIGLGGYVVGRSVEKVIPAVNKLKPGE